MRAFTYSGEHRIQGAQVGVRHRYEFKQPIPCCQKEMINDVGLNFITPPPLPVLWLRYRHYYSNCLKGKKDFVYKGVKSQAGDRHSRL